MASQPGITGRCGRSQRESGGRGTVCEYTTAESRGTHLHNSEEEGHRPWGNQPQCNRRIAERVSGRRQEGGPGAARSQGHGICRGPWRRCNKQRRPAAKAGQASGARLGEAGGRESADCRTLSQSGWGSWAGNRRSIPTRPRGDPAERHIPDGRRTHRRRGEGRARQGRGRATRGGSRQRHRGEEGAESEADDASDGGPDEESDRAPPPSTSAHSRGSGSSSISTSPA